MELVPPQHQATLAVGSETMFSVFPDARGNDIVGSIAILVPGTLQKENVSSSELLPLWRALMGTIKTMKAAAVLCMKAGVSLFTESSLRSLWICCHRQKGRGI